MRRRGERAALVWSFTSSDDPQVTVLPTLRLLLRFGGFAHCVSNSKKIVAAAFGRAFTGFE